MNKDDSMYLAKIVEAVPYPHSALDRTGIIIDKITVRNNDAFDTKYLLINKSGICMTILPKDIIKIELK